jgi:crinkler effector protein
VPVQIKPSPQPFLDDQRRQIHLTCLVEGDKNAFVIFISRDAYIDQLTELIYERRKKGLFRDVNPADLTILKVNKCSHVLADQLSSQVELNIEPLRGHFSRFRPDRHHHSTELDDFSMHLSEFWEEQPPARHLHVFVKLQSRDGDLAPLPPPSQQRASFHRVKTATQLRLSVHLTSVAEARAAFAPSSVAGSVGKYKQEQIDHPIYN